MDQSNFWKSIHTYTRVPNKWTGLLLENEKKMSHLYVYFHLYFYSFLLVKEISKTFCYIKPLLKPYFCMKFNRILNQNSNASTWFPMAPIRNSDGDTHPNGKQIIYGPLLNATKIPTYTFIQAYTFIRFQEIFPPILLFSPILLLVFQKISHLYVYSESSSIRNSRVIV